MKRILLSLYASKWRLLAGLAMGLSSVLSLMSPARAIPQNLNAYVSNNFDNTVSVINATNNNLVTTTRGFYGPIGVAMTPNGRKVYVTNGGATPGTVSVIRTGRNRIRRTITVGTLPVRLALGGPLKLLSAIPIRPNQG